MKAARATSGLTVALAAMLALGLPLHAADQPLLSGDTRIHDPSVIEVDGEYAAFGTGEQGPTRGAIRVKTSPDGVTWRDAGAIGKGAPKWAVDALGYQPTNVWAPSISRRGATFSLYYALSSFGSNVSAIGLMTNTSFDVTKPGEGWKDQGPVLTSKKGDDFNAIDPFRIDVSDGRVFLAFGSFWSGVKLRELDPETGKLKPNTPAIALAGRHGGAIEAPSILERDGKFYLFVSFDQCCKGVASTYNIRVGRADRIEGPYFDRDGKTMLDGGGSLLLAGAGRYIGPGGQEALKTTKGDMLAYHYYDGDAGGVAKLELSPIRWTPDGWPELDPLPR
ncbi:MAG TPA: arabinan endo-1,5-alpha-L-arabinosidase [Roseiarcus sp.]|jgi:arabinan endo-1,5-alpha-L-arabinosidase|nr:arabinan endo-1,5-alpha-L-arabinosidase [Roseiarcus sp.]